MSASVSPGLRHSLPWRLGSLAAMSLGIVASRAFLYGLNHIETTGLDHLLNVLDRRKSQGDNRDCGLLTVCNHVGVLDDPLIWGILPLRYALDVNNLRWALGAHDICFKNRILSTFFSLGQVLPTRRLWHSPLGGLYQPTMTQAIGLLSSPRAPPMLQASSSTYSTDGKDCFPAPAAYRTSRNAWLHVFPEGCCHQSADSRLRYFKWGISRLILETEPAPDFMPIFIHGTQSIMPEDRTWPRWLPRIGNKIKIVVGQAINTNRIFGSHRTTWKRLLASHDSDNGLKHNSPDAIQLRVDVARLVRDEVQKLRLGLGLPPEPDDSAALAETWAKEPNKRKFKSPVDGSIVNRH